jgi:AcrR family transcriptional regulator
MSNKTDIDTRPATTKRSPGRKRLHPDKREAMIVEEAIRFFAEIGFDGKTRDLASRMGITQPLLYRYFPSKESLIERVYQEVYVQRWNVEWDTLLPDRSRPLPDRLTEFYQAYSRAVYDYVWVRIFLFSGLKNGNINDRYLSIIREKVLVPVCQELRHNGGLASIGEISVSSEELELAWGLHGMFFYRAVRHYAYNMPIVEDTDQAIANDVKFFLAGVPTVHKDIIERAKNAR